MTTPRKRFAHTSNTWQLFQKYFFLDGDRYPYTLGPMPRGNAINLVQGLNCCNVQWADEQSMPHIFLTLSAKAKKGAGENDLWEVEISTNYRKQGIASPSKESRKSTDWMAKLLAADTGSSTPPPSSSNNDTASSPSGEEGVYVPSPVSTPEPKISHMENALEGWLSAPRTPEPPSTDDPHAAAGRYPLSTEGEKSRKYSGDAEPIKLIGKPGE